MLVVSHNKILHPKSRFKKALSYCIRKLAGTPEIRVICADTCKLDVNRFNGVLQAAYSGEAKTLKRPDLDERICIEQAISSSANGSVMKAVLKYDYFSLKSCRNLLQDGTELGSMIAIDGLARLAIFGVNEAKELLEWAKISAINSKVRAYSSLRLNCIELIGRIVFGEEEQAQTAVFLLWASHAISKSVVSESLFSARDALIYTRQSSQGSNLISLIDILTGKKEAGGRFLLPDYADASFEESSLSKDDGAAYGASSIYFRQTTRNGVCWFLKGTGELIPITNTGKAPLQFVVCGPFSDGSLGMIADACRKLKRLSAQDVIVKNVSLSQKNVLEKQGFAPLADSPEEALWSDMNFPGLAFDLEEMTMLKGTKWAKLRHTINKFSQDKNFSFEDCDLDDWRIVDIATKWAKEKARNERHLSYLINSNLFFREYNFSGMPGIDYIPRLLLHNDEPVGFTLGWRTAGDSIGIYVCIASEKISGIGAYMRYELFKNAFERDFTDYKTGLFGPSELPGLHVFKTEFGPHTKVPMFAMAFKE